MRDYLDGIEETLHGEVRANERTGAGTYVGPFKKQLRHDLNEGFPLITTKKVWWKAILEEGLWYLRGENNVRPLNEKGVTIWNSDAMRHNIDYILDDGLMTKNEIEAARTDRDERGDLTGAKELKSRYKERILTDEEFAENAGVLGPIYGPQFRGKNGAYASDQVKQLEDKLRAGGNSRRMIVSAWNPKQLPEMALPPCHTQWQVQVMPESKKLNMGWTQRSGDVMLGVPFNRGNYALFGHLLAHTHGYELGELVGEITDFHVYQPHEAAAREQIQREPRELPQLKINAKHESITEYTSDEIELVNYNPHPKLENPTPMFGGFL